MRKLTFGLAAVAAVASAPAFAATTSGTVNVTLNVDNACSLTTGAIDFGVVTDFTAATTAASATTLKCTPNAVATVTVNSGNNPIGAQRRLASGTNFVDYNITDSANVAWPAAGLSYTGGQRRIARHARRRACPGRAAGRRLRRPADDHRYLLNL